MEEIEELKTYIETELEFLKKCGEFFENASDLSEPGSKEDLVNQYQELIVSTVEFLLFYLIFTEICKVLIPLSTHPTFHATYSMTPPIRNSFFKTRLLGFLLMDKKR